MYLNGLLAYCHKLVDRLGFMMLDSLKRISVFCNRECDNHFSGKSLLLFIDSKESGPGAALLWNKVCTTSIDCQYITY